MQSAIRGRSRCTGCARRLLESAPPPLFRAVHHRRRWQFCFSRVEGRLWLFKRLGGERRARIPASWKKRDASQNTRAHTRRVLPLKKRAGPAQSAARNVSSAYFPASLFIFKAVRLLRASADWLRAAPGVWPCGGNESLLGRKMETVSH